MKLIIGDILKSLLDGEDYMIKKVVENMAMLESQNGKKQILTEVDALKLFYRRKEEIKVWTKIESRERGTGEPIAIKEGDVPVEVNGWEEVTYDRDEFTK